MVKKKSSLAVSGTTERKKSAVSEQRKHRAFLLAHRKLFIFFLLLLLTIILVLLLLDMGKINLPQLWKKPITLTAIDRCSLIAGKLIHSLNDEGSCHIQCTAECEVYSRELSTSTFIFKERDCHQCTCLCT